MKFFFTAFFAVLSLFACSHNRWRDMSANEFYNYSQNHEVQVVDVRTTKEYLQGHIVAAINLDIQQKNFIQQAEKKLNKSNPVAVYCRSGHRSAIAAQRLSEKGFKVANLKSGFLGWKSAGKPITSGF